MMPIKEFVHEYFEREGGQNLPYGQNPGIKSWNDILESGGYIRVIITHEHWTETRIIAQWCREKFGVDHYYWTGGAFWFDSEEHAAMFMLRWK